MSLPADGQHHSKPGLQVGGKVGISSYSGDLTASRRGESRFDLTYEGELFYRFSRLVGIGLKHSVGKYPELSELGSKRNSTAIALRSYLTRGRIAPYVQVGASHTGGGVESGFGLAVATGFELEISRFIALYQDVSFDQVLPDRALDGLSGGRKFDLFGRLGFGVRFNLVRSRGSLRFADISVPDSLGVGEVGEFVATVEGAEGTQIRYTWNFPGDVVYSDNPARHVFAAPGQYDIQLRVADSDELIREWIAVTVTGEELPEGVQDGGQILASSDKSTDEVLREVEGEVEAKADDTKDDARGRATVKADAVEDAVQGSVQGEVDEAKNSDQAGVQAKVDEAIDAGDQVKPGDAAAKLDPPYPHAPKSGGETGEQIDPAEVDLVKIDPVKSDTLTAEEVDIDPPVATSSNPEGVSPTATVDAETGVDAESGVVAEKGGDVESGGDVETRGDVESGADTGTDSEVRDPDTLRTSPIPASGDRIPPRTIFSPGDYTWIIDTARSEAEAGRRADRYKFLGFPYGYKWDPASGTYVVLVGQFVSERIARNVSWRIQSHAPRTIRLYQVK